MGQGAYVIEMLVGVIVVVVSGQLIRRNSAAYLAEVYEPPIARRVSSLVTTFFHLIMLGVVALVASVGLGVHPSTQEVTVRVGVMLVLAAAAYLVTLRILTRMRDEQESTELSEATEQALHDKWSTPR